MAGSCSEFFSLTNVAKLLSTIYPRDRTKKYLENSLLSPPTKNHPLLPLPQLYYTTFWLSLVNTISWPWPHPACLSTILPYLYLPRLSCHRQILGLTLHLQRRMTMAPSPTSHSSPCRQGLQGIRLCLASESEAATWPHAQIFVQIFLSHHNFVVNRVRDGVSAAPASSHPPWPHSAFSSLTRL